MLEHDGNFPRWAAPFMGMAAGALVAIKAGNRTGEPFSSKWLLGGMILGGLAGALIFLIDVNPASEEENDEGLFEDETFERKVPKPPPGSSGTVISRFFAVLSLPLFWVPVVNVIWSGLAVFLNRKALGWPKKMSKIGLGLSVLVSLLFLAIFATKN